MSITKDVTVFLKAAGHEAVRQAFAVCEAGAQAASATVKTLGKDVGHLDVNFRGLGATAIKVDRSFKVLERSLGGMSSAMAGAHGHVARLTSGLGGLHKSLGALRGVSTIANLAGGGPWGIAAAVAGIAMVTDKIQEQTLAANLNSEALKRMRNEAILSLQSAAHGYLSGRAAHRDEAVYHAGLPYERSVEGYREQIAGLRSASGAARAFPNNPNDPTLIANQGQAFHEAGANLHRLMIGPESVTATPAMRAAEMERMQALVNQRSATPTALLRQRQEVQEARQRAEANQAAKRAAVPTQTMVDAYKARAEVARLAQVAGGHDADAEALGVRGFWTAAGEEASHYGLGSVRHVYNRLAGGANPLAEGRWNSDKTDREWKIYAARNRAAAARQQLAQAEKVASAFGDTPGASEDKRLQALERVKEANEKVNEARRRELEIVKEIGQADIANLQTKLKMVEGVKQMAEALRRQREGETQSAKISLGLMSPTDQQRLIRTGSRLAAGQRLSKQELQFATAHRQFLGERLDQYGLKQFEALPGGREFLQQQGFNRRENEAKQAEQGVLKLEANVKNQLEVAIKADEGLQEQLREQFIPQIEKTIVEALQTMKKAIDKALARAQAEAERKQQERHGEAR